jgi:hypothetical protein
MSRRRLPHADPTRWMAVAIELIALTCAIALAVYVTR